MTVAYSVIVPAYNEQAWLDASLPALKKAMETVDVPGEIIVVDNNSSDRTAAVARQHGARVVFEPINQISRARNAGAKCARGAYLVFLDADTLLPPELLHSVLDKLRSGNCCGGGALVVMDHAIPWYTRWILLGWNSIAVRWKLAAGCFIYCLREGFDAVGGFSQRVFASEEIWFSRSLCRWGRTRGMAFEVLREPRVVTSARKMQDHPLRNLAAFCFILMFPLAVRFRRLSRLWYYR